VFYIPVLKSKQAERAVLMSSIDKIDYLLPYIEFTRPLDDKNSKPFLELLQNKLHFEQYLFEGKGVGATMNDIEAANKRKGVVVLNYKCQSLHACLEEAHKKGIPIAIRSQLGERDEDFCLTIKPLNDNDYLFVDCGETTYQAAKPYLNFFIKNKAKCHIIVLNQDRKITSASTFVKNYLSYLDTSYVKALNDGELDEFFGYANYATIKNEKTEENQKHGYSNTLGICIISQLDLPSFKIISTKNKDHIGRAYTSLNKEFADHFEKYKILFRSNNLSIEMLTSYVKNQKANAEKYIALGALCYFEEISRQISALKLAN